MLLVYCEKCGLRIADGELASGRALQIEENQYLCAACKPAAQVPEAARHDTTQTINDVSGRVNVRQSPGKRGTAGHPSQKPGPEKIRNSKFPLVQVAAGAAIFTVIVALFLLKGGSNDNQTRNMISDTDTSKLAKADSTFIVTAATKTNEPAKPAATSVSTPPAVLSPAVPEIRQTHAEREQQAMKELQEQRAKREAQLAEERRLVEENAAKALAEHRAWFVQNPDKNLEYKQRLRALIATSRGTDAAKEAQNLADGIKLPGVSGRFVRIENPNVLMLAEVEVFGGGGESLAKGKNATQSNTYRGAEAKRAVDGNTNGNYYERSVSHSGSANAWWEVDLGREETIDTIAIWNRMDMQSEFLNNFTVSILKNDRAPVWSLKVNNVPKPSISLKVE